MTTATARPQAVPVNLDTIPVRLKQADRWVGWRYVEDVDRETGEVSWDKPPVCARNGGLASSTNPETWASFNDAAAAYQRGHLDGLGFVLSPSPGGDARLVGVDLDKCRDPETGDVEPWAAAIVAKLDSYTEVSPSGRGLRIFLLGRLPPKGRKKGKYENYEYGRYVTVTGQQVPGARGTIEYRQDELAAVHKSIFGDTDREESPRATVAKTPTDLDDQEIVRRASGSKNGEKFRRLWEGDRSGYGSASEADLALCSHLAFWCGPGSEARIASLFEQSGLFRSKWKRDDYRARTIEKALKGRTEFYKGSAARQPGTNGNGRGNGHAKAAADDDERPPDGHGDAWEPGQEEDPKAPAGFEWKAMDLPALIASAKRPEMLAKRVLARGQPMIVGAPQKTLKTSVMCDLAVSLATGTPFLGHFDVYEPVRVALFSGESGEWTLAKTLQRVCQARGLDPAATAGKLLVQPEGLPQLSNGEHMDYLRRMLKQKGVEVFILDPLYLTLLAGMKGDPGLASNLYAMGPLFQNVTGACLEAGATPVLVHHTQRAAARSREPLGLEDLAYSGVAEFARQWFLMSRREDYDGSSPGTHKLWVNAGGSAGHGGLWALDIEEGEAGEDLEGRGWDVTVSTATEARQCVKDRRDAKQQDKKAETERKEEQRVATAVDELVGEGQAVDSHGRPAATFTKARNRAGLNNERMNQTVERLIRANVLREVQVQVKSGNGANRPCRGLQRVGDND
jgi:hypothetical protein